MLALIVALAIGGGGELPPPLRHHGKPSSCSQSVECAIQAGDKAGNWWVLKSDGTMLSGSALTMSATGSPGTSPMTFNGSSQYYSSAAVAYPATNVIAFTVIFVAKFNATSTQYVVNKWPASSQTFICGIDPTPIFYLFSPVPTFESVTHPSSVSTGTWVGIACSFDFLSNTGQVRYYVGGTGSDATATVAGVIQATTNPMTIAATASTPSFNGSLRGALYTEKFLSDADMDRLFAGAM